MQRCHTVAFQDRVNIVLMTGPSKLFHPGMNECQQGVQSLQVHVGREKTKINKHNGKFSTYMTSNLLNCVSNYRPKIQILVKYQGGIKEKCV